MNPDWYPKLGIVEPAAQGDLFLASMGIYVFNRDLIRSLLDNPLPDFGKHIIPQAINERRVSSHVFQGYWEDIGTIRSFFEANLDLVSESLPISSTFFWQISACSSRSFAP